MSGSNEGGDRNRTTSENSDVEYDPQFKPIISLPEVEIVTNEEEEDVMLKLRAKLFRFDSKPNESPEWKERGTGEVKLLKHNVNKTVRVVMRRDKTLKVCANHFITPWMELKPSRGSERAYIYNVFADFADELAKPECLAIRFGSVDNANQFKEKFNEAREFVRTECTLYTEDHDDDSSDQEEVSSEDEGLDCKENTKKEVEYVKEAEHAKEEALTEKLAALDVNKVQGNEVNKEESIKEVTNKDELKKEPVNNSSN